MEVQYGDENAMQVVLGFLSRATKSVDTCGDSTMPSIAVSVEPVRQFTVGLSRQGLKLRSIAEVTKDNLPYSKELAKYVQLRHMPGIKGSFAIRDGAEYVGTTVLEEAKPLTQVIRSDVRGAVEQHQYLFETLWSRAIPAQHRFREIEEGIEPEFMRVIADPDEAAEIFVSMAGSIKNEALLLLPESRSLGMAYDTGVLQHLVRAAENNAVVRIMCPLDGGNADVAGWIARNAPGIRMTNSADSRSTILLADNSRYFRAELRKAGAAKFFLSIGFTIYSNSRPTVDSFKSFFELLWKSAMLNEELKKTDRMQKEFINIAAHELRSPIQPILGYAELLESSELGKSEEVQGIIRNALRLQRLTNDLLDVARIESNSFNLNREQFNLGEVIANTIRDMNDQHGGEGAGIAYRRNDIAVQADKYRITQVVFNLLSNAVKFAEKGAITIESQKKGGEITIAVKDEGLGIDPDIMPRLFTKFATKSEQGTGLGLYISKAIVDAHGGRIRAENNKGRRGATFTVILPA
jgi:two-component system sensor histidine kinase VicK